MNKITSFLEKYLLPIANKVAKNRYLLAIRDSFLVSLPFTMIGSLFVALLNFPFLDKLVGEEFVGTLNEVLSPIVSLTTGVTSVILALGIGYSLSKYYKLEPFYGALTSLSSFLLITPISIVSDKGEIVNNVLPLSQLGASGMFSTIIISFLSIEVYRLAIQKNWTIKMPDSVPDLVSNSFFSFIPISISVLVAFTIRTVFTFSEYESMNNFIYTFLQQPLGNIGTSLPMTILSAILVNIFWFFGLHGHSIALSPLVPMLRANALENVEALQAGKELPHIVNESFSNFFSICGGYVSIPVLICLLIFFKKKKEWKQLGTIALVPGIFGVYEPLIFGLPIMLNPILFIPLIITAIVPTALSYTVMYLGWVPYTNGVSYPFTMPLILSGILSTNSLAGGILQLVILIILTFVWYVFMKVLFNQSNLVKEK